MPSYESKMDARGRVTIPLPVRRALGLEAGGRLVWRQMTGLTFELLNAAAVPPGSAAASAFTEGVAASQAPVVDRSAGERSDV
jgi:hypothetical protein